MEVLKIAVYNYQYLISEYFMEIMQTICCILCNCYSQIITAMTLFEAVNYTQYHNCIEATACTKTMILDIAVQVQATPTLARLLTISIMQHFYASALICAHSFLWLCNATNLHVTINQSTSTIYDILNKNTQGGKFPSLLRVDVNLLT